MRDFRSLPVAMALAALLTGHAGASSYAGAHVGAPGEAWSGGLATEPAAPPAVTAWISMAGGPPPVSVPGPGGLPAARRMVAAASSGGADGAAGTGPASAALGRDGHPTTAPPRSL